MAPKKSDIVLEIEEIAHPREVLPENVSTQPIVTAENAVSTSLADYIDHICKQPLDTEKRYIVLDVHGSDVTQFCTFDAEKADEEVPSESTQSVSVTEMPTDAPHVVEEMHVGLHVNISPDQDKPIDAVSKVEIPVTTQGTQQILTCMLINGSGRIKMPVVEQT
ncbi:hypothetical protein WMY93_027568 [Mugilogobius chulae]|uniref:Uncharacterized protein n=1 Tax=Mugilogobius chulae TaxID=88201 RepID=A0AAW0MXH3_9GOBI